jgi:hypothetical protein
MNQWHIPVYAEFDLRHVSDSDNTAFQGLRVALFRMTWDRWIRQHNVTDSEFTVVDGCVRIRFDHPANMSIFALKWQGHSYRIVQ